MLKRCLSSAVFVALGFLSTAASAEEGASFLQPGIHSEWRELRFGVLAYDRGFFSTDDFSGVVVNGEYVFSSPEALERIGSPRPYIGFDAAIADDPIHFFYAGLNWDFHLAGNFYLSASLGGAITTAENLDDPSTYRRSGVALFSILGRQSATTSAKGGRCRPIRTTFPMRACAARTTAPKRRVCESATASERT